MPTNLTDVDAFTSPIVAPADGDVGEAATWVPGYQGLANRTHYLNQIITGETSAPANTDGAIRTILIPGTAFHDLQSSGVAGWHDANEVVTKSRINSATTKRRLFLPHAAKIIQIDAAVLPGASRATVGNRMLLEFLERTYNWASPAAPTLSTVGSDRDSGSSGAYELLTIDLTSSPYTVDNAKVLMLAVSAGNDGGTNFDFFSGVRIQFKDPGLRNF